MTDTEGPSAEPGSFLARSESARGADEGKNNPVTEMRFIIGCEEWGTAVAFYRDALGLRQIVGYKGDLDGQMILEVGRATIELVHPELPDNDTDGAVNLSSPSAPPIRVGFRATRAQELLESLESAGADIVESPRLNAAETLHVRLIGPDSMPITVFKPMGETDFAEAAEPLR